MSKQNRYRNAEQTTQLNPDWFRLLIRTTGTTTSVKNLYSWPAFQWTT
ncbi:MAG: hypothetical protein ABJZ55_10735 [Fuerstiella sp.]